jgi:hypothetical protein
VNSELVRILKRQTVKCVKELYHLSLGETDPTNIWNREFPDCSSLHLSCRSYFVIPVQVKAESVVCRAAEWTAVILLLLGMLELENLRYLRFPLRRGYMSRSSGLYHTV